MTPRVAYLNTHYPKISHTFIEREIQAVRRAGVEIETFSIRLPAPSDLLSQAHRDERDRTTYLLDSPARLLLGLCRALTRFPIGCLRGLHAAQRLSPPGFGPRALHLAYFAEAARLVVELAHRRISHIHVHMANNGAMVALLACRIDPTLSYSLTIHGSAEFFDVHRLALGTKAAGASFVRCISNFCRAQVMAWSDPAAWDRFRVVHCGVDLDRFSPVEHPGLDGPLRLLTIGRLEPIKGYPLLLDALHTLRASGLDATLSMIGDGPMRPLLRERIRALDLSNAVTLVGPVGQDEIGAHLDAAHALVVSSFMEGIPVVLMEAMAKGLPVVTTAVGGVPELVDDGVSGFLTRTGSSDDLATALRRLADARPRFRSIGQAGRERVRDEFNIETIGSLMADLFRSLPGPSQKRTEPAQS